ncbi:MAG TPA: DUF4167 domain-containing protein [Allosphingosinicella sp.]|nr:DUF4167 domain-containing protein [Allosphingosinicella sp.]
MINNRQGGRRRGRGGGGGGRPPGANQNPGNRQDNRQRGNAAQLLEKYKGLARDAQMQGDRVQTEYYLQYADHYFRVLNENRARFEEQRRQREEDEDEAEEFEAEAEGNEAAESDDPRRDDPRYSRREERDEREDRPERSGDYKAERSDRGDRNGEYRAQRRPRRRAEADEDDGQSERISLDVLPPAIAAANEDAAEEKPARARRPRRPRATDEDIAPAA